MKTFKTEAEIIDLVREGNSIVSPSDFSKLAKIGKKYETELIFGKVPNVQLWYSKIVEQLQAEPRNSKFIKQLEERTFPRQADINSPEVIQEYIKYLGIYESEYLFLCSKMWDELHRFSTHTLGSYGIDTTGGATIFLKNGGDYYGYISQYSKKHCEPSALKQSTELRKTIDAMFKGLETPEKLHLANVIQQYASGEMDADLFHNTLFAGQ